MAMMAELFAGFDSLKNLVERISESVEKGSDSTSLFVRVFHHTNKQDANCC